MTPLFVDADRQRIGSAAWPLVLIILLLGGLARPAPAQHDPSHTPFIDSILAAEDSIDAAEAAARADADTSNADQHAILRGLNALDDVLPTRLFEVLLVLSFVVIPIVCAGGFAAVALFSESGCLRVLLAIMGWLAALLGGLIGGGLLGTLLGGGLAFFIWTGVIVCGIGYLILYARAGTYIKQLPREKRLTWKHTLTGAALLGTGASSAASLGRSAGALFKGGGGNFGGGGASGAFGSGQIAQVTAASAQGGSAPGAVVLTSGAAAAAVRGGASVRSGRLHRWAQAVLGFARRLRWYHGVAFVLVLLIFLPVGMGVAAVFQRPRLLLWIVGVYTTWRALVLLVQAVPTRDTSGAVVGIMFIAFFISPVFAAESQAPYWHLTIVGAVAVVVEIGLFVLPDNRPKADPPSRRKPSFRGGGPSERW